MEAFGCCSGAVRSRLWLVRGVDEAASLGEMNTLLDQIDRVGGDNERLMVRQSRVRMSIDQ
jgi:hypothetical protein